VIVRKCRAHATHRPDTVARGALGHQRSLIGDGYGLATRRCADPAAGPRSGWEGLVEAAIVVVNRRPSMRPADPSGTFVAEDDGGALVLGSVWAVECSSCSSQANAEAQVIQAADTTLSAPARHAFASMPYVPQPGGGLHGRS